MRCPFSLARFSLSRAIDEVSIARSRLADELPKRCDFGAPRVQGVHVKREDAHERCRGAHGMRHGGGGSGAPFGSKTRFGVVFSSPLADKRVSE